MPSNIGTIDALESIAFALGHPDGVEGKLKMPMTQEEAMQKFVKRKISIEEIMRLRSEGKGYLAISKLAGVSPMRIKQLIQKHSR